MSDLRSFHVCIASLSGKRSCWDLDWLFKASQNHQALSCKYNLIFLTRLNSVGDWVKLHSGGSDVISCARLGGFRVECVSSSINSPTKAKANDKAQISGRMVSSGISDVAFASVYFEKTRLKKCWIMIIIIMKKLQETTAFGEHQKLTSAMKQRPQK